MNNSIRPLKYLGRHLKLIVFPEYVYFLYSTNVEDFTRLVEYKKFTRHESPTTLVGMEITINNGAYDYPMPFQSEQLLCQQYFVQMPPGVSLWVELDPTFMVLI